MKKSLSIFWLLALMVISCAQSNQSANSAQIDPALNEIQNQFLNNQAEALLSQADEILSAHPPGWPEPPQRKSALFLMDGVLHDVYAPERPPVQEFFKTRISKALEEIEQTEIKEGARIWKLYNHGFLVRTSTVTIGFDLVRGKSVRVAGFSIGDNDMGRLIDQCDVLFISHYHNDHTDEWVAQSFVDQGKPVIAPPEVWKDRSIYTHITHLERESHTLQTLPVQGGQKELKVVVYPGHQGSDIENNVSLVVTPEGLSFSQMGDQSNGDDFKWIDEVANHHIVDVLMPNCWTTDIVRVAKGFSPSLIITGHENEMGHTIDHREPYWLTYQRQKGSERFGGSRDVGYDTPLILMTWGESYHYKREVFLNSTKMMTQEDQEDFKQIKKILFQQEEAWNKGNIDVFMDAYWNSEDLQFGGANGITRGWQQTLDRYKAGYPDRATMGNLTFQIKDMTKHSREVVSLTGSWVLKRENDTPGGHFLLLWKKIDGKWRIVVDHTSQKTITI